MKLYCAPFPFEKSKLIFCDRQSMSKKNINDVVQDLQRETEYQLYTSLLKNYYLQGHISNATQNICYLTIRFSSICTFILC